MRISKRPKRHQVVMSKSKIPPAEWQEYIEI